jgi:hypothetical protein
MFGMLDHQSRMSFAREHADRLKDVMRASRRARQPEDDKTGRCTPARTDVAPRAARLRFHRGAV